MNKALNDLLASVDDISTVPEFKEETINDIILGLGIGKSIQEVENDIIIGRYTDTRQAHISEPNINIQREKQTKISFNIINYSF